MHGYTLVNNLAVEGAQWNCLLRGCAWHCNTKWVKASLMRNKNDRTNKRIEGGARHMVLRNGSRNKHAGTTSEEATNAEHQYRGAFLSAWSFVINAYEKKSWIQGVLLQLESQLQKSIDTCIIPSKKSNWEKSWKERLHKFYEQDMKSLKSSQRRWTESFFIHEQRRACNPMASLNQPNLPPFKSDWIHF